MAVDDFQKQLSGDDRINDVISRIEQIVDDEDSNEDVINNALTIVDHLLGDYDSMNLMFDNGKGKIVSILLRWLRDKRVNLKATACLGIGNIARSGKFNLNLTKSFTFSIYFYFGNNNIIYYYLYRQMITVEN